MSFFAAIQCCTKHRRGNAAEAVRQRNQGRWSAERARMEARSGGRTAWSSVAVPMRHMMRMGTEQIPFFFKKR